MTRLSTYIKLSLLFCASVVLGCQKTAEEKEPTRLFTPANVKVYANNNGLTVMWDRSPGAQTYELEVSRNEAFDPIDATVVAQAAVEPTAKVGGLREETLYFVRIKGVGAKPGLVSNYAIASGITGFLPSLFKSVPYEEMGYTSVTLRWKEPELQVVPFTADKIVLTASGSEDVTIPLTGQILSNKSVFIDDLRSGVAYTATMYDQDDVVSYIRFTMPQKPAGAIEVDNVTDFMARVADVPDGSTIILEGGKKYVCWWVDIDIDKSITIMGAPGASHPIIYAKQFILGGKTKAASTIGEIKFSHVEISGLKAEGGIEPDLSTSEPNSHAFGVDMGSTATRNVTISKFTLENCTLRNFNQAVIRIPWSIGANCSLMFDEIYVDGVLAYDLGRLADGVQCFIHLSSNTANNKIHCKKYTIRNSTFYYMTTGLIEARKGATQTDASPTLELTNCTFDRIADIYPGAKVGTTAGSRFFFCFTGFSATVNMSDCVFGDATTSSAENYLLRRDALSGAAFGTCVNNYMSNTCLLRDFATKVALKDMPASALFPARDVFDYTIAESAMIMGAGDPRWVK